MSRKDLVALVAGLVFALGLGLAGMTDPRKVIAFLDVAGAWDPSLALVMVGAIGVHVGFVRRARASARPRLASVFAWPTATALDWRLLTGAATFGLGWGVAGFCPGPVLVSLVSLSPATLAFVGAMIVGMLVYGALFERGLRSPRPAAWSAPEAGSE